jgi:hypothetical protein
MSIDADALSGLATPTFPAAEAGIGRAGNHARCAITAGAPNDAATLGTQPLAGVGQARMKLQAVVAATLEAAGWSRRQAHRRDAAGGSAS